MFYNLGARYKRSCQKGLPSVSALAALSAFTMSMSILQVHICSFPDNEANMLCKTKLYW